MWKILAGLLASSSTICSCTIIQDDRLNVMNENMNYKGCENFHPLRGDFSPQCVPSPVQIVHSTKSIKLFYLIVSAVYHLQRQVENHKYHWREQGEIASVQ